MLIGPGGVGKGTLAQRLTQDDSRLWLSRSWTTRPKRAAEHGDEYVFVDRSTFQSAIDDERFLEWAEFHGNLYGTPLPASDDVDVLLEIEVQGAQQVLEENAQAVVFLILPPSMELLKDRLQSRGDSADHVDRRLRSAPLELAKGHELATHVIVNDDIERAAGEILSILEGLRQRRRPPSTKD